MENKNCAVCSKPMRLIPAGVSKNTGKAYDAFYACPDRCKQPKVNSGVSNQTIEIMGEILADIQVKVNAIYSIINKEMPQE